MLDEHKKTIDDHDDVAITAPADGQALVYEAATALWKNKTVTAKFSRAATIVVAASNAKDKDNADYVCDGVADEAEIEAAIAALPASGGLVQLSEGTFYISTPIDVLKSNVTIAGMGTGLTNLFLVNGANCNVIVVGNGALSLSNVCIRDLTIDGNRANQTAGGIGIYFYGASDYILYDCSVINVHGVNNYNGTLRADYCHRAVIIGCWSVNDRLAGFQYRYCQYSVIFLCVSVSAGSYGYYFLGCNYCVLGSCVGKAAGTYGFYGASINDCNVVGCNFSAGGYGISVNGYRNAVVGNVCYGGSYQGIYLVSAYDCVVDGNSVNGYGGSGIYVYSEDYNVISNNRCTGNAGYGINIASSYADRTFVHGNELLGNTTGALNNLGTGTDLADNITA